MLVYSVFTNAGSMVDELSHIKHSIKCNNLFSFYDKSCVKNLDLIRDLSKNILVDSGAFSLFNSSKKKVNFDKYLKQYMNFIGKSDTPAVQGYFELDIDSLVGYDTVLDYRSNLLEVSDKIIPVWHKRLGVNEYKRMVNDFDYVAIGGIVSKEIKPEELPKFVKYAHNRGVKFHALGLTSPKWLDRVPFDSVDSLSWFRTRFGSQYYFKDGKVSYRKVSSKYLKDNYAKIDAYSYLNHIKFQEYYEDKWRNYTY